MIEILGPECPLCDAVDRNVRLVVERSGIEADIERVRDLRQHPGWLGVRTPAVVVCGELVVEGHAVEVGDMVRVIRTALAERAL